MKKIQDIVLRINDDVEETSEEEEPVCSHRSAAAQ
jgi:hypothetical protein